MPENNFARKLHKLEHNTSSLSCIRLAKEGISLYHLKNLEERCLEKRILKNSYSSLINPLWFYAEMEFHVKIWQSGLSLSHTPSFVPWILIKKLIEKRKRQLSNAGPFNPIANPLWHTGDYSEQLKTHELTYLANFTDLWNRISEPMTELNIAYLQSINEDITGKEIFVLP